MTAGYTNLNIQNQFWQNIPGFDEDSETCGFSDIVKICPQTWSTILNIVTIFKSFSFFQLVTQMKPIVAASTHVFGKKNIDNGKGIFSGLFT